MAPVTAGRYLPVAALILASILAFVPGHAEGAGEITVSIVMDNDFQEAEVSPGSDGVITYTGRIFVTAPVDPQFQFAMVDLEVESGTYPVTEIAPIVIFTQSQEAFFSFSIQIPPGSMSSEVFEDPTEYRISGEWYYEPGTLRGEVTPYIILLDVKQYYLYRMESSLSYVQTSPGGEFDVELVVHNEGNGGDRVKIDLMNREHLDSDGWSVILGKSDFDLAFGQSMVVPVKITAPVKWKAYENSVTPIKFSVTSLQAVNDNEPAEVVQHTIYVRQRGISLPGFELPLMLGAMMFVLLMGSVRKRGGR